MPEQFDYGAFYAQAFRQFVQNSLESRGISATQLAEATGLSRSYCSKLVNSDVPATQPSASTLSLVCWALGVKSASFLYELEKLIPLERRQAFAIKVEPQREEDAEPDAKPQPRRRFQAKTTNDAPPAEPVDVRALIQATHLPERKKS